MFGREWGGKLGQEHTYALIYMQIVCAHIYGLLTLNWCSTHCSGLAIEQIYYEKLWVSKDIAPPIVTTVYRQQLGHKFV